MPTRNRLSLALFLALFFLSACGSMPGPGNPPAPPAAGQPDGPEEPAPAPGNALRRNGCTCGDGQRLPPAPPLKWSGKLERAAQRHSKDMAQNDHFSHRGADRSTMDSRVADAGYRWATVAENIALATPTIPEVVEQWRKSTHGHCQNMMDKAYTEMGAAGEVGPQGRYWTLVLASPL